MGKRYILMVQDDCSGYFLALIIVHAGTAKNVQID